MAQLTGKQVAGMGWQKGVENLLGNVALQLREQKRKAEVEDILKRLAFASFDGQGGPPMFSEQNAQSLGRLAELAPETFKALQMTQPHTQFIPGFRGAMDVGQVYPSGKTNLQQVRPSIPEQPRASSRKLGWTATPPKGFPPFIRVPGTDRRLGVKYRIDEDAGTYVTGPDGKPITDYESGGQPFNPMGAGSPTNKKIQLVDRYNAYPEIKKAVSMGEAADLLDKLADSNSPIEQNAIATIAARASGEVGNLSEADKAPFGGSQAIADRLAQFARTSVSGVRTADNVKYIHDLARAFRGSAKSKGINVAKKWAGQYSKAAKDIYGGPDEIYDYLTAELPPALSEEEQADGFEVGEIYTDDQGNKAKYLGNGNWEEVR